jgi:hypothetical protein
MGRERRRSGSGLAMATLWWAAQLSCSASGSSSTGGPEGCGDLSGRWSVSGSCAQGSCVVTQSGCSLAVACADGTRFSGVVSGATFTGTGSNGAGADGVCSGTLSTGRLNGMCAAMTGSCAFTAACTNGACGAQAPAANAECTLLVGGYESRRAALGCDTRLTCLAENRLSVGDAFSIPFPAVTRDYIQTTCVAGWAAARDCDELNQAMSMCIRPPSS